MMRFLAVALLFLAPLIAANPIIEVREASPSWPERFALLDRDGCYKLKRDLGIENVHSLGVPMLLKDHTDSAPGCNPRIHEATVRP